MNTAALPLSSCARGADLPGNASWLETLRRQGLEAYESQGIPGRRSERWKYTNVRDLVRSDWVVASGGDVGDIWPLVSARALSLEGAWTVVVVNGRYDATLTDTVNARVGYTHPVGLDLRPLDQVLLHDPEILKGLLGQLLPYAEHPFAALNTGLLAHGLFIRVPEGVSIDMPVHVVAVHVGGEKAHSVQSRIVLDLGRGSRLVMAESHVSADEHPVFANWVREIRLSGGACLDHVSLQNMNVASTWLMAGQAVLGGKSSFDSFSFLTGSRLSRSDLCVELSGSGARALVNGAYTIGQGQHVDTTTFVDHAAAGCASNQVWKGVLDGESRGVFQGRVLVRRDAQQTDGQQLHKALMLSRGAEVDTKPELLIYADDVKCSHGAAAGALDEDALFYLRARGIPEDAARALLIEGFLDEAVDLIGSSVLREAVMRCSHTRLEAQR